MSWKTISTQTLVEDYHATVKRNKVELPDGAIIDDSPVKSHNPLAFQPNPCYNISRRTTRNLPGVSSDVPRGKERTAYTV